MFKSSVLTDRLCSAECLPTRFFDLLSAQFADNLIGYLNSVTAVVDESGFLWTGCGTFLYNSTDVTTYSVLRFDTSDTTAPIRAFQMSHEANVSIGDFITLMLRMHLHASCIYILHLTKCLLCSNPLLAEKYSFDLFNIAKRCLPAV